MRGHTLFISDLHLAKDQMHLTQLFLDFLENQACKADALYILGDLFEAWIGDDDLSEYNLKIITALRQFTDSGIPTFFMNGNRDFLISNQFAQMTGCQLLTDPISIELYGKQIILSHGDLLCTADKKHLKYRHYAYNPKYNRYFLMLPLAIRRITANIIRTLSQNRQKSLINYVMDVTDEAVKNFFNQHNADILIHGHTHRLGVHELQIQDTHKQRIVLGAWHEQGNALSFDTSGNHQFLTF